MRCMLPAFCLALVLVAAGCGPAEEEDGSPRPGGAGSPATAPDPGAGEAPGTEQETPAEGWRRAAREARQQGARYLLGARGEGGRWSYTPGQEQPSLPISGLAALAVLSSGLEGGPEAVRPVLEWVAGSQKGNGAIYQQGPATYSTAISVLLLKAAGDPRYEPVIAKAAGYIRKVQFDQEEGFDRSHKYYGGVGYDRENQPNPNLSTTAWTVDAARAAGIPEGDPFYQRALVFLQRMQNRSESNDAVFEDAEGRKVVPGNDGGAFYSPQESKAGTRTLEDGRLVFRSYGSMSYALLRSYLFCQLDPRDPRVRAVTEWVGDNWTLTHNPGMEHHPEDDSEFMGLYYYYLTLARTLDAAEARNLVLEETPLEGWRGRLAGTLVERQRDDGSWVNQEHSRWWEDSPVLVTAYGVLALSDCLE